MNKTSLLLVQLLIIIAVVPVDGQRTVTGKIVDKETGRPVKEAQINHLGTNAKATTNAGGYFQLQVDSTAKIEILSTGYRSIQVAIPPATANFKIELEKQLANAKAAEKIPGDKPADFPGGIAKFYSYISENIQMPKEVRTRAIEERVFVEFVIDTTGQIPPEHIKVIKGGSCGPCNREAMRLVKGSPPWIPGRQRGKAVAMKMVLPIQFVVRR